jgi:hypothetical protein
MSTELTQRLRSVSDDGTDMAHSILAEEPVSVTGAQAKGKGSLDTVSDSSDGDEHEDLTEPALEQHSFQHNFAVSEDSTPFTENASFYPPKVKPKLPAVDARRDRIEEIELFPGRERGINVWFNATQVSPADSVASVKKFKLFFKCFAGPNLARDQYSAALKASAQLCSSTVTVSKTLIDFGICDVGVCQTAAVQVKNPWKHPTSVELTYRSKCITTQSMVWAVPARSTIDISFEFTPRTVTSDYRKLINITNLQNPQNLHTLEIRANNVNNLDQHGVVFHSSRYLLHEMNLFHPSHPLSLISTLDFRNVVFAHPALRPFYVESKSECVLVVLCLV